MKNRGDHEPESCGIAGKHSRIRYIAGNCMLIAMLIGCGALFAWTLVNPRHLPSGSIYGIILADYLVGFAVLIVLLIRRSANQPLDAKSQAAPAVWESDFQSWNSSTLGIRLLATEQQLEVLTRLFELGNCIDNTVSPARFDESKRQALLKLIQQPRASTISPVSNRLTQVLFSGLQYSEGHHVSAILRELRSLGNPALVPQFGSAPDRASSDGVTAPDIHFEEIRATGPQCVNVLTALAILHSDQETLLRASSESSASEISILLRPAHEAETRPEQLLRSADDEK